MPALHGKQLGSLLTAICLVTSLVTVVGCGKKRDKSKEQNTPEGSGKVTTGTPVANTAENSSIALPSNEPKALNPILQVRANRANMLIFEGLVGLDRAGKAVPRLAESWTHSDDKQTLTFTLRKNVKWSDGQPFTSKDVSFTFSALRGLSDVATLWAAFMIDVDRLETPDDLTVIVHYSKPYAPALMTWTMGILPEHVYKSKNEGDSLSDSEGNLKPVGTGPYKLSRWDFGKRLILVANDKWWYGKPKIGRIELSFDAGGELLDKLEAGKLDFVDVPDNANWVSETQAPKFLENNEATTVRGSLFRVIAWNTARKPFDNPDVRAALTHALNRQAVVEDLLLGQGQLLSAPLFPSMFGTDPSIAPRRFDLSKAAALLDKAGLKPGKDGRRFGFTITAGSTYAKSINAEMFAAYRRDLSAIGVDLRVEYIDYLTAWKPKVVDKHDFDAAFFGWLPEIPDPDPFNLIHSSQIETGYQNFASYRSDEADGLLEQARAAINRDERRAIYERLHAVLHRDLPYTVAYSPFRHYAWSRRLRGVHPSDVAEFARFPGVAAWWVEK